MQFFVIKKNWDPGEHQGPHGVSESRKIVKTKVVELDEPVNSKPVAPSDLFSNGGS